MPATSAPAARSSSGSAEASVRPPDSWSTASGIMSVKRCGRLRDRLRTSSISDGVEDVRLATRSTCHGCA
jgi:hypothetical protein